MNWTASWMMLIAFLIFPFDTHAQKGYGECMLACGGNIPCGKACDTNQQKNLTLQRLSMCNIQSTDPAKREACKSSVAVEWVLVEHNPRSPNHFFIPLLANQLDRCVLENPADVKGFEACRNRILSSHKNKRFETDKFLAFPLEPNLSQADILRQAWIVLAKLDPISIEVRKLDGTVEDLKRIYELKAKPSPNDPKTAWVSAVVMNAFDPTELASFKAMDAETCQSDKAKLSRRQAESDCKLGCENHFVPEQCEERCVESVKFRFGQLTEVCPPPPPPVMPTTSKTK